jgi:hypothetical protein
MKAHLPSRIDQASPIGNASFTCWERGGNLPNFKIPFSFKSFKFNPSAQCEALSEYLAYVRLVDAKLPGMLNCRIGKETSGDSTDTKKRNMRSSQYSRHTQNARRALGRRQQVNCNNVIANESHLTKSEFHAKTT